MKTVVLIKIITLLVMLHTPAWAYHKWYDEKGTVHYTQADPPGNAKNKDGSSWWGEEPDQAADKGARQKKIEQARIKIKKNNAPQPGSDTEPVRNIEENTAPEIEEEASDQESEPSENQGFFKRLVGIFSKDEKDESVCEAPWLLQTHGICALSKPDMGAVGNTFEAEVVNNRKCVWSDCRGTYNGDIVTFTYKGGEYWETDGNVPECSFYRGFYWK
jgi:hypothetical protein